MIKSFSTFRWIIILLLLPVSFTLQAQPDGKALFKKNCASCHNKNMKDDMTGPALGGAEERWADYPREDLYSWVRNSAGMIQAGHPRARARRCSAKRRPIRRCGDGLGDYLQPDRYSDL